MVAAVPGVLPVRDAAWVDVPPAEVLGGGGLHPAGSAPPQHDSPGPGQTAASRYNCKVSSVETIFTANMEVFFENV